VQRDGWDFTFDAALSADGTMLWLSFPLSDLPDNVDDAAALKKLLAENDKLGPSYFSLSGKRFYLETPVANLEMTPAKLRQNIDSSLATVKSSQKLWDVKTWTKNDQAKTETKIEEKK
jgi:hypothetical protein